jgi:hypothetical protein
MSLIGSLHGVDVTQAVDLPTAMAIHAQASVDPFVCLSIPVKEGVGAGMRLQPTGDPVQVCLLVVQQHSQRSTYLVGKGRLGEILRKLPVHAVFEDVRESQRLSDAARGADLVEIEALVTASNAHRLQAEPDDRPLP